MAHASKYLAELVSFKSKHSRTYIPTQDSWLMYQEAVTFKPVLMHFPQWDPNYGMAYQ